MSSAVVCQPPLTRMADEAWDFDAPIAVSTCETSIRPDEQAEPALTANPFKSKSINCTSLETPGIATQLVLGRRDEFLPNIVAPKFSISDSIVSSQPRNFCI